MGPLKSTVDTRSVSLFMSVSLSLFHKCPSFSSDKARARDLALLLLCCEYKLRCVLAHQCEHKLQERVAHVPAPRSDIFFFTHMK